MNNEDIEIGADEEPRSEERIQNTKSAQKAYSNLQVELTVEELNSSGVQKLLLNDISRLQTEANTGKEFEEKYHEADKSRAILQEKGKTSAYTEILYTVSLTLGATLIGLSPSVKSDVISPYYVGIVGGLLVIGAILAKVKTK